VTPFERFVDTFLNPRLMARYWPDIAQGMLVTVEIALAVVVTGVALGLGLAVLRSYRVGPSTRSSSCSSTCSAPCRRWC
jgi:polar amino acid transport system permease protein